MKRKRSISFLVLFYQLVEFSGLGRWCNEQFQSNRRVEHFEQNQWETSINFQRQVKNRSETTSYRSEYTSIASFSLPSEKKCSLHQCPSPWEFFLAKNCMHLGMSWVFQKKKSALKPAISRGLIHIAHAQVIKLSPNVCYIKRFFTNTVLAALREIMH